MTDKMSEMTPQQRLELCKKLDDDLDSFIAEAMKRPRIVTEDNRSIDEIVAASHKRNS